MAANENLPIDELYQERDAQDTERLWNMHLQQRVTPEGAPVAEPSGVTPEGVVQFGNRLTLEPVAPRATPSETESRRALAKDLQQELKPKTFRDVFNGVLGVLTGGVITLDKIDKHLEQSVQGIDETDLARELKSVGALKILDPVGNTAEALVREQATKDGLPQDVVDKMGSVTGMMLGMLAPGVGQGKVAKAVTNVYYQSLLSNPATHAANITANALTAAWQIPERLLAATASAGEWIASGAPRTVFFGESVAMGYGMAHEVLDAIRTAGRSIAK